MTRDEAIDHCRCVIAQGGHDKSHDYIGLPEFFIPHEWVIQAVQQAHTQGTVEWQQKK